MSRELIYSMRFFLRNSVSGSSFGPRSYLARCLAGPDSIVPAWPVAPMREMWNFVLLAVWGD